MKEKAANRVSTEKYKLDRLLDMQRTAMNSKSSVPIVHWRYGHRKSNKAAHTAMYRTPQLFVTSPKGPAFCVATSVCGDRLAKCVWFLSHQQAALILQNHCAILDHCIRAVNIVDNCGNIYTN